MSWNDEWVKSGITQVFFSSKKKRNVIFLYEESNHLRKTKPQCICNMLLNHLALQQINHSRLQIIDESSMWQSKFKVPCPYKQSYYGGKEAWMVNWLDFFRLLNAVFLSLRLMLISIYSLEKCFCTEHALISFENR